MIFVDTSAFLARYVSRDQHHSAAVDYWQEIASSNEPCCTSNFVIDELLTLLARRTNGEFAAERARHLYASEALQILRPNESDETAAVIFLERYADNNVSFTDCVSFVLMKRHKIVKAFAFDTHFKLAGFTVCP